MTRDENNAYVFDNFEASKLTSFIFDVPIYNKENEFDIFNDFLTFIKTSYFNLKDKLPIEKDKTFNIHNLSYMNLIQKEFYMNENYSRILQQSNSNIAAWMTFIVYINMYGWKGSVFTNNLININEEEVDRLSDSNNNEDNTTATKIEAMNELANPLIFIQLKLKDLTALHMKINDYMNIIQKNRDLPLDMSNYLSFLDMINDDNKNIECLNIIKSIYFSNIDLPIFFEENKILDDFVFYSAFVTELFLLDSVILDIIANHQYDKSTPLLGLFNPFYTYRKSKDGHQEFVRTWNNCEKDYDNLECFILDNYID